MHGNIVITPTKFFRIIEQDTIMNFSIFLIVKTRCIGSTQHLKNKYGGGYLMEIKCGKNLSNWDELHQAILSIFEEEKIKVEETFADRRTYSVLQSAVKSLGEVFASLEKCKKYKEYFLKNTFLVQG